ncbi:MAG: hypothetical protein LBT46_13090 [Planctomycetaceae bacterium]|jgi:ABC-type uncharacterized transport system ATPase subunit|nr:hypothetical protein [Planctomycetaceae bacterium]
MNTTNTFFDIIRREEQLLERLLYISRRQLEIVRNGNMTVLLQHLGQRQQLWNEFELLEEQMQPHKEVAPEQRVWKDGAERQTAEQSLERCKVMLAEILVTDNTSLDETFAQKTETELQLKRIQRAKNVVPAYAKHSKLASNGK